MRVFLPRRVKEGSLQTQGTAEVGGLGCNQVSIKCQGLYCSPHCGLCCGSGRTKFQQEEGNEGRRETGRQAVRLPAIGWTPSFSDPSRYHPYLAQVRNCQGGKPHQQRRKPAKVAYGQTSGRRGDSSSKSQVSSLGMWLSL